MLFACSTTDTKQPQITTTTQTETPDNTGVVEVSESISINDTSTGWASYTGRKDLEGNSITPPDSIKGTVGGINGKIVTVSTRSELMEYIVKPEPYIIFIDGMIDISNGMVPDTYNGSTDVLDRFIEFNTRDTAHHVSSYSEWKTEYAKNVVSTEDHAGTIAEVQDLLNKQWEKVIRLNISSNKSIIGKTSESGIYGGNINIYGIENVIIRNLNIINAYNPFPKMEENDGLNADFDDVSIQHSKYIWIDHCTIQSKFTEFDHVTVSNGVDTKWQVYDGLLDITNTNDFVTVSWCKFIDNDKTMLIGSSSKTIEDINHQTITLHHNYFLGCRQRLPMARFATIHIYNNYYSMNNKFESSYAIGVREQVSMVAQNNYFDTDIKYSFKNSDGTLYATGNIDNSISKRGSRVSQEMPWFPSLYYSYTVEDAATVPEKVKTYAGAGLKILE